MSEIPFNKPYLSGNELQYIREAVASGKISGNGTYTKKCSRFFEQRYGFQKCLLTTSCTDALEMAAILLNIQPGDEVIMPAFTFVSTANAFVLRGAGVILCDSRDDHPGMDENRIEELITEKTKAIIVVHYAGVACNMDQVMALADKYRLFVVEDAAHATDSYYRTPEGHLKPLGSIGHLAAFSFHETKNLIAGEGGMLVINDPRFNERAEIIWEKGTNRCKFFRGETDKYSWVDVGSSFLPSEIIAAFLYAQTEQIDIIQQKRKATWQNYQIGLQTAYGTGLLQQAFIPAYACNNAHMYYVLCQSQDIRDALISGLRKKGIMAVFHYVPLHQSDFFKKHFEQVTLPNAERYGRLLLRLPLYCELNENDTNAVCTAVTSVLSGYRQAV